uniref:NADH-ubiquinone oxidoreductase chain 3 n=1 Tax=Cafileria marina TaxID=2557541 RepID=A0A5B9IRK5_9STRA|nr:NADH dehydrogenase subunit 3 [Cafileria marina]QEF30256.1 NADH dehydrogenase subunit 3 [Cafileria marina]
MSFYINKIIEVEYSYIGVFIILNIFISSVLMILSYFIVQKNPYKEKISAYECGFEPFEDTKNKVDVRFYIVAILFLIFDIEVIYLFPWAIALTKIGYQGFWAMMIFLIILILGFIYEIYMNALDWQ